MNRRIAILGAGMSGLAMAWYLRRAGYTDLVILEKAQEVGGTWRDNRYPGVACDVPSHLYSFSFALNPRWSHAYSPGGEIQAYCKQVAQDTGLDALCRFGWTVSGARFDDKSGRWHLTAEDGRTEQADIVISGLGGLHIPSIPDLPGLADFSGARFHSAQWPDSDEITGRDVAIIGSAASAVQIVPAIADKVKSLTVFQRTANWILPRNDRAYPDWVKALLANVPGLARLHRWSIYWRLEKNFPAFKARGLVGRFIRNQAMKQLEQQIPDAALRAKLTPDYPPGCKRILVSDNYFPALQKPHVHMITDPLDRVEPDGVRTKDGVLHKADTLVLATGFKPFDLASQMTITGRDGQAIGSIWHDGIAAHRSVALPGFPNYFLLLGPNSALGHNSVVLMIEAQARYLVKLLQAADRQGKRHIEPLAEAYQSHNDQLQTDLGSTIWRAGCSSWYQDAQGRVYTLWPHSTLRYFRDMAKPDLSEYRFS